LPLIFDGVYGLNNILNDDTVSFNKPYSYVPAYDITHNNYPYNLYDWINFHSPRTRKIHKIELNGKQLAVPCERNKLQQSTKIFEYDNDNLVRLGNFQLPFIDWYKGLNGLSVQLTIDGNVDKYDDFICRQAVHKWSSIINSFHNIKITITFKELGNNVLGSAGATNYIKKNGKVYVTEGRINLNTLYWNDQKAKLKNNHKCSAFYTLLHEMGHVLGIGTLWLDNQLLSYGPYYVKDEYWNSDYTTSLYIGENGVREYKSYVTNKYNVPRDKIFGIPIEDDGGAGTKGSHTEEGDGNNNVRYFDGEKHYGLDHELMTGYSENSSVPEPLSRITIGMLEDIGYKVDYSKADSFQ
jgi:hypothetical protein